MFIIGGSMVCLLLGCNAGGFAVKSVCGEWFVLCLS